MADLTPRRRAFVEHYLTCWNQTEAARLAGYAQPGMEGSRLMKNDDIARAIQERLAELKVGADEVLTRLAGHARSNMADFIDVNELPPVLKKAADSGKLHVVKKVVTSKRYFKGDLVEEKTEFELYDAQAALVQLGKHHRLFSERIDVIDWRAEAEAAGLNPGELFEELVQRYADTLAARAKQPGG